MSTQLDDKVWFDSARKLRGICADVATCRNSQENVLVLAHFPATLAAIQQALRSTSIPFEVFSLPDSSMLCSLSAPKVLVGLVRALHPASAQLRSTPQVAKLQIIVGEHHPISGKDRDVVQTVEKLPCKPAICFHAALDDPLMKHFGSDQIISLMKRMGADENEPISHQLVTRAIRNAQEKIEKHVQRDMQTESMEDWFRFNLRG
jgi:preprotein translocase subunit SecA